MDLSSYRCPACGVGRWETSAAFWQCTACGQKYTCVNEIPKLYLETGLGRQDQELRDRFYNGLLGTYYQHVMPFLSLPVRPAAAYWRGWIVYVLLLLSILTVFGYGLALVA